MNDTPAPGGRVNADGDPCPQWCATDHSQDMIVAGETRSAQGHWGRESQHAAPGGRADISVRRVRFASTGREAVKVIAWQYDGGSAFLEARDADDAEDLARLILAAAAIGPAAAAAAAAAIRAAAADEAAVA